MRHYSAAATGQFLRRTTIVPVPSLAESSANDLDALEIWTVLITAPSIRKATLVSHHLRFSPATHSEQSTNIFLDTGEYLA